MRLRDFWLEKGWTLKCGPCREGVVDYINCLLDCGIARSVSDACRFMSRETDGEWEPETLRKIYVQQKAKGKVGTRVPTMVDFWQLQIRRLEKVIEDIRRVSESTDDDDIVTALEAVNKQIKNRKLKHRRTPPRVNLETPLLLPAVWRGGNYQ